MTKSELAQHIVTASLLRGQFTLRSGQTTNEYFDKYQFEAQPTLLREIARALAPLVPTETEVLAGLELGGVPIATALSLETGLPVAFVRKARKTYGTCKITEGASVQGSRVLIVEDVITTGGAVFESARELRREGALLRTVISVLYRGNAAQDHFAAEQLERISLFSAHELG